MARKRKRKEGREGFSGAQAQSVRQPRLTPADVQQKVFRLAFRGYNERDVDEFLDHITETLAELHEENKRLREAAQEVGMGAPPSAVAAAERQAAEVVRKAREHAARLVEAAERRASELAGAPGRQPEPMPASFLVQEREFLQRLASLIQSHGRTLKEQARRVREESEDTEQPEAQAGPAPAVAAQPPPPAITGVPAPEPPAAAEGVPAAGAEVPSPEPAQGGGTERPPMDEAPPRPAEAEPPVGPGPEAEGDIGSLRSAAEPSGARRDEPATPPPSGVPQPPPPGAPVMPTAGPSPADVPAPAPPDAGHDEESRPAPPDTATPDAAPETAVPSSEQGRERERGHDAAQEDAPTVPWRPPEPEAPSERGWPPQESEEEGDPLLSAWESAFLSDPEEEAGTERSDRREDSPGDSKEEREDAGGEPSLRELFWGEE